MTQIEVLDAEIEALIEEAGDIISDARDIDFELQWVLDPHDHGQDRREALKELGRLTRRLTEIERRLPVATDERDRLVHTFNVLSAQGLHPEAWEAVS